MTNKKLPSGLEPKGSTPTFTEDTLPAALLAEHALAPGRWGVLHLVEGRTWFVDLTTGKEHHIKAPGTVTIEPEAPHKLRLDGPIRCRIDFYRELQPASSSA